MPMTATRSRIPLLAMLRDLHRLALPEVVVDPAGRVHPPETHAHAGAYLDLLGGAVRELAAEAAAAVEVHGRGDDRRGQRVGEVVDRVGRDRPGAIGHRLRIHLIRGAAAGTNAHGW